MKSITRVLIPLSLLGILFITPFNVFAQTPTPEPGSIISGDQIVIANTFRLKSGDVLDGNLLVVGGTATIESGAVMTGDVFLTGGTLTLSGLLNGDLIAIGGAVNLDDTATVNGDVVLIGATMKRSPLAKISGEITEQMPKAFDLNFKDPQGFTLPFMEKKSTLTQMLQASLQALAMSALAVILGLLLPQQIKRVAATLAAEPLITGGVGLLSIVLAPIILVLFTITIILIPITALSLLLLMFAALFGWIAVGYEIGERMAGMFKTIWHPSISAGIGVLLLSLVTGFSNLIPCIGWVIGLIVGILGLGAVVISRFGSSKYANKMVQAVNPTAPIPPVPPAENGTSS
ncbi:MAG: polymer-forming cytoskeletal protein [Chloroflexi bacterium]|nr:polymer-forming cytoskeletal protein [Chloroflexota bacterium]